MPNPLDHSPLPGRVPQTTAELSDLATLDPLGDPEAITPYNFQPYYGEGRFAPYGYNPYFDNSPSPRSEPSKVEVLPRAVPMLPPTKAPKNTQTIDVDFEVVPSASKDASNKAYKNQIQAELARYNAKSDSKAASDKAYKKQVQAELDRYNLDALKAEQHRQLREQYREADRLRKQRDDDYLEELNSKRKYHPPTKPQAPSQPSNYPSTPKRTPPSYPATPNAQHQPFTANPYPKQQPLPYAEPAEFRQKVPWSVTPPGGAIVRPPKPWALAPIPKPPGFPVSPPPLPLPGMPRPMMPPPRPGLRPPRPSPMPRLRPPIMSPPGGGAGRPAGDYALDPFFGIPPYASPLLPLDDPGEPLNPNNPIQGFLNKYFPPLPGNKPHLAPPPFAPTYGPPVAFPYPKGKGLALYKLSVSYTQLGWHIVSGFSSNNASTHTQFEAYEILGSWVESRVRTDSPIYKSSLVSVVRTKETKNADPKNISFFYFLSGNEGFGTGQGAGSSYMIERVTGMAITLLEDRSFSRPQHPAYPFPFPDDIPQAIPYGFPDPYPSPPETKPFPLNNPFPKEKPAPSPQPKPIGYPQPQPIPAPQPLPFAFPSPQPAPTPENQPIPDVFPFPSPNPEPNLDPNPDANPTPQPKPKVPGFPFPSPMPQNPPKPLPKPDPKPLPLPKPVLYYPPPPPCPVPVFDMPCRFQKDLPKSIVVRVFDRCYIAGEISIPAHRAMQISVLPGTEDQVTELFERVFELEALQCLGGFIEEDKIIELSIPVVTCEQDSKGVKAPKTSRSTIEVRQSQSAAIAAQFEALAAIQKDLCKSGTDEPALLKKVYRILGGDAWNFNQEGVPNRKEKFDEEFKTIAVNAFKKSEGGGFDEQDQDSENLLTWLKRCFGSTYFRTGIHGFPTNVNKTMLSYSDDEEPEKISTLSDYLAWFIQQFDLLLGQFPVEIEIEDADPLKKGNQKKTIELANLSESIGELYGLATIGATNADLAINFLVRLAAEMVSTKSATLITQDYAKANASFLGYEGKAVEREIEFAFNPLKADTMEGFEEFLANSKAKIVGWEETDKASMVDYMQKLMFSASIIKAAFFRNSKQLSVIEKELESLFEQGKDDKAWQEFIALMNDPASPFNAGVDAGEYPLSKVDSKPVPPTDAEQKQKKP